MTNTTPKSDAKISKVVPNDLSVPVNFRLSKRSYRALQKLAAKEGLRVSPFLRTNVHRLLNESGLKDGTR